MGNGVRRVEEGVNQHLGHCGPEAASARLVLARWHTSQVGAGCGVALPASVQASGFGGPDIGARCRAGKNAEARPQRNGAGHGQWLVEYILAFSRRRAAR